MGANTRGSLVQPRKRNASLKQRESQRKIMKAAPKRVTSKKFIHPNDINKEVTPEEVEDEPPVVQPLEDLSNHKYTLSWQLMLGSVEVAADSDIYKLGQFNYREFNTDAIKKITKAATKAKVDFEYVSGGGALGAKGISKALELPLTVNDEEGWKKAESFVEKSMREKQKGILVRLVLKYAKKCTDDASDSDEEKPDKYKGKKVHLHLL